MNLPRRATLFCLALFGLSTFLSRTVGAEDWTLKSIDGKTTSIALTSIDEKGRVFAGGKAPVANLDDLRELHSGKAAPRNLAPQSGVLLDLIGGGRVAGASVETKGEHLALKLTGENAPEVQIPLEAIAAVRFSPAAQQPAFQDALAHPAADSDQVLAIAEGQLQPLKGLLSKITADGVEFEFEGQPRTLEKSKVYGIVLAKTSATPPRYHRLMLTDGSVLPAKLLRFADGGFHVQWGEVSSTIPAVLVQRIEFMSDRLIFVSDLEPIAVQEKPLLMLPKPWQRDRAIRGGVIKLGGVEYTKGIGCQPQSQLTFKLPSGAESFLAVVGLDASTKGKGSCVFQVMGDGRSLFQRAVTGKDAPVELSVDVSGVEELTLIVEPGDDLDLSDHADWADARLLLKASQ
jgi:hypothetical protein